MIDIDDRMDMIDEITDMDVMHDKEKIFDRLEVVINQMKEEDRIFLSLKYFDNYSIEDLQNKFTLSKSAVKMRLARARKRMEQLLFTNGPSDAKHEIFQTGK